MAKLTANELRNGTVFIYKNTPWSVKKYEHIKKGRGSATIKVKIRNIQSGELVTASFDQNQEFEEADVVRATGQFLYEDGNKANFMHTTDYSQYEISTDLIEDELQWLAKGGRVTMVIFEENLVAIELPKSVELQIEYAEPAVKGDTSSGATKTVKLETGAEVQVPLFIKKGEKIKVNTEKGEYISRV